MIYACSDKGMDLTLKFGQISNEYFGLQIERWLCSILLAECVQRFVGRLQICQVQPVQTLTNPVDLCVRMRKI